LFGALRVPGDGVCYPPAIANILIGKLSRETVTIRREQVIAVGSGTVTTASGGTIATGAVVIAAGAHSATLVPHLPVIPRRGHLVITDGGPELVRHQVVELGYLHSAHTLGGATVAFNVQPRRNGQLLIGSSRELVGFANAINRDLVARMMARAIGLLPALGRRSISRTWVGFRPATPDSLPLIGRWPEIPGVWIATGHEGLGITMAPGTADIIAMEMIGGKPPVPSAPFRPDRPMPAGVKL
jgi:glycine/D-amino acid oxidase-like deaminating enzyme